MKKFNLPFLSTLVFVLVCCASCTNDNTNDGAKSPLTVENTDGTIATSLELNADVETYRLWLTTTGEWQAQVPEEAASWLTLEPSEGIATSQLRINFKILPNDYDEVNKTTITFVSKTDPGVKQEIEVTQRAAIIQPPREADLLDIEFRNDGTAVDISPKNFPVSTFAGPTLMTYYSDAYERYVAQFSNALGASTTSGFYNTGLYSSDQDFKDKLSDGFTMEALCRLDVENPGTAEIKMLGSTTSGGMALMIIKAASSYTSINPNATSYSFTFLAYIGSGWKFPDSGVVPEVGRYYHLVGVYNKTEGKLYIYIDGVEKGTQAVTGDLKFPTNAQALRFGIGVGSGSSATRGEAAWNGNVAMARIYSDALTPAEVKDLWRAARVKIPVEKVVLSDVEFVSTCSVAAGYKYTVYAKGFKNGDKLQFASTTSDSKFDCETTIAEGSATATIPAGMASDKYRLLVKRGNSQEPLGFVEVTVAAAPEIRKAKIIAHRGYHSDGAPENSIAAFAKAQEFGAYAVECDAWITTDNVLVVHHDPKFTGASVASADATYAQIKDLTLPNGEKLPTLDAFLEQAKKNTNTKLMIEVKPNGTTADARITQALIEAVKAKGLEKSVEFIAFNYDICKNLAAAFPDMLISYLSSSSAAPAPASVKADGIRCIDYYYTIYNTHPTYIADAHALGMYVNVWTINTKALMLQFIGANADFISTDDPDMLRTLLGKTYVSAK